MRCWYPLVETGRILVQDRRSHRPPPWGFFGGGIEVDEAPLQALFREIQEELSFILLLDEPTYFGKFLGWYSDLNLTLHAFLWSFDGSLSRFCQTEGTGIDLISVDEILRRTEPGSPDHTLTLALKGCLRGCDEASGF
jgi:8-oxo-dGTP pyrophosphatase MutT (NUDIX family)